METTNISSLQIDPIGPGSERNRISMTANETYNPNSDTEPFTLTTEQTGLDEGLDPSTVNLLINGLQQASVSGATKLPSRDIPMQPSYHTNDEQVRPNYIPTPAKNNYHYIDDDINNESIVKNYNKRAKKGELIEDIYDEIQTPLLLAVLYFLFQLPFFKKWLFVYIPGLFLKDGNMNIYGFGFTSFLFGSVFYIINKISTQLS
jgi:hypothetical protein